MTMPDRDVAVAWVGRTVVDRDGTEIGACTAVFADDATEQAEWVCSELSGVAVLIPAVGAAESSGQVQVVVSRDDVAAAPSVKADQHISIEDEVALYRHYGIPHSREDSPSLLPTDDTPSDSLSDSGTDTSFGSPESGSPETPAKGRKGLVSGGLAGLVALGAALAARQVRRRRRPRSRVERLADRGRAASAVVAEKTGRLDLGGRGKAGAAAGTASAVAALLAARRRRSRADRTEDVELPAGYR